MEIIGGGNDAFLFFLFYPNIHFPFSFFTRLHPVLSLLMPTFPLLLPTPCRPFSFFISLSLSLFFQPQVFGTRSPPPSLPLTSLTNRKLFKPQGSFAGFYSLPCSTTRRQASKEGRKEEKIEVDSGDGRGRLLKTCKREGQQGENAEICIRKLK